MEDTAKLNKNANKDANNKFLKDINGELKSISRKIDLEKNSSSFNEETKYAKFMYDYGYNAAAIMGEALDEQSAHNELVKELSELNGKKDFNKKELKIISAIISIKNKNRTQLLTKEEKDIFKKEIEEPLKETQDLYKKYNSYANEYVNAHANMRFVTVKDIFAAMQYEILNRTDLKAFEIKDLKKGNVALDKSVAYLGIDNNTKLYTELAAYDKNVLFLTPQTFEIARKVETDLNEDRFIEEQNKLINLSQMKFVNNINPPEDVRKIAKSLDVIMLESKGKKSSKVTKDKFVKSSGTIQVISQAKNKCERLLYVMEGLAAARVKSNLADDKTIKNFVNDYIRESKQSQKVFGKISNNTRKQIIDNFKDNKNNITSLLTLQLYKDMVTVSIIPTQTKIELCNSIDIQIAKKMSQYINRNLITKKSSIYKNEKFEQIEKNHSMNFTSSWLVQFMAKERIANATDYFKKLGLTPESIAQQYSDVLNIAKPTKFENFDKVVKTALFGKQNEKVLDLDKVKENFKLYAKEADKTNIEQINSTNKSATTILENFAKLQPDMQNNFSNDKAFCETVSKECQEIIKTVTVAKEAEVQKAPEKAPETQKAAEVQKESQEKENNYIIPEEVENAFLIPEELKKIEKPITKTLNKTVYKTVEPKEMALSKFISTVQSYKKHCIAGSNELYKQLTSSDSNKNTIEKTLKSLQLNIGAVSFIENELRKYKTAFLSHDLTKQTLEKDWLENYNKNSTDKNLYGVLLNTIYEINKAENMVIKFKGGEDDKVAPSVFEGLKKDEQTQTYLDTYAQNITKNDKMNYAKYAKNFITPYLRDIKLVNEKAKEKEEIKE